jgi:hypothetical protein
MHHGNGPQRSNGPLLHGQMLCAGFDTEAVNEATAIRLRIKPEFKFSKCSDEVRDAFFGAVRPFEFCVRAIVVQKELIYSPHLRSEKEAFYRKNKCLPTGVSASTISPAFTDNCNLTNSTVRFLSPSNAR